MTIDLSLVTFDNGLFQTELPNGNILYMYELEESLGTEKGDKVLNGIIIEIQNGDEITGQPTIIGLEEGSVQVLTDYEEIKGQVLTSENKDKCYMEISDE